MFVFLIPLTLLLSGCTQSPKGFSRKPYSVEETIKVGQYSKKIKKRYTPNGLQAGHRYLNGSASYYAGDFHGKYTASCVIFDATQMVAAHPTLQLPSVAKVTRLSTNKSIYVIITDRGPFAKGRICDLSKGAAQKLDYLKEGHTKVKIQILKKESEILLTHWNKFVNQRLPDELFKHINNARKLEQYLNRIPKRARKK